jgi:hypothetical protein
MLPVVIPQGNGVTIALQQTPWLNWRTPFTNELSGRSPVKDGVYCTSSSRK